MFEKRELRKEDIFGMRLWLLDLSDRLEPKESKGDKLVYKLGRQCEKLKEEAAAFENAVKDLRVEHGTYEDGRFIVKEDSPKLKDFEQAINALKNEEVEVEFLSRKIEESELESVKGLGIKDFDYMTNFM